MHFRCLQLKTDLKYFRTAAILFFVDIIRSTAIRPIIPRTENGIVYRGLDRHFLKAAFSLYSELNSGESLPWSRRLFYHLFGRRMAFVATIDERVVGIAFYCFKMRDIKANTVHSSFSGVSPAFQGKGIGTEMRRSAMLHFFKNGVSGYSSRISLSNTYSMRASLKLGFRPVEKYYDKQKGEERCYMLAFFDETVGKDEK